MIDERASLIKALSTELVTVTDKLTALYREIYDVAIAQQLDLEMYSSIAREVKQVIEHHSNLVVQLEQIIDQP